MARKLKHLYRVDANGFYLVVADNEQEAKTKYKSDAVRGGEFPTSCVEYASFEVDDEVLTDKDYFNLFLANAKEEPQEIPDFASYEDFIEEGENTTYYLIAKAVSTMNEREKRDLLQMIEKLRRAWKRNA